MTTERALTTLDIFKIAQQHKDDPCAFARAIEQAVLQSTEIQALRKDAGRYRWLRRVDIEDMAVVLGLGAMDYGSSAVVYTYSEELVEEDLDEVIDAAMEQQT